MLETLSEVFEVGAETLDTGTSTGAADRVFVRSMEASRVLTAGKDCAAAGVTL